MAFKNPITFIIFLLSLIPFFTSCQSTNNKIDNGQILIDNCQTKAYWLFTNGGEFPGAKANLTTVSKGNSNYLNLSYDFSNGGKYACAIRRYPLPPASKTIQLDIESSKPSQLFFRIQDANNRTFQTAAKSIQAKKALTIDLNIAGPWRNSWGGLKSDKKLKQPIKSLWICVSPEKNYKAGNIQIKQITGSSSAKQSELAAKVVGKNIKMNACGWQLTGRWNNVWNSPRLHLKATSQTNKPASLEILFTQNGRNANKHFTLEPGKTKSIIYVPPINGGNPYNQYYLDVKLSNRTESATRQIILTGVKSDTINFGAPVSSAKISTSTIGTCCHFSYGQAGAFKGWRDYKKLTDMISNAGIKWIRDGVKVKKHKDGTYYINPYDLKWMKYAKKKGLKIITVIDTNAQNTPEEYAKMCKAVVRQTNGLSKVFELGNEPHNMGGWRKKYKGPWNGKERDNSTSRWVKEHLKMTNAGADAIRNVKPDAIIIGLGACTPTNYRYLDLGVTKNLDGVVDHPYTYSSRPENIPFSEGTAKRDGVRVNNEIGSFEGLIKSYIEKFKSTGQMRSIWVTEFGFPTFWFNGKNEKCIYAGFTEHAQAVYIIRRFLQSFTLPIKVSCQYDFIDDYGSNPHSAEANFGLIKTDYRPKQSYYAVQRLTSLFNGYNYDPSIKFPSLHAPQHRATSSKSSSSAKMAFANKVLAYGFSNPKKPTIKQIAVWSSQALVGQFNNRSVTLAIDGLQEFSEPPVAIDMITGKSYDINIKRKDNSIMIENLSLEQNPILIKLIKCDIEKEALR